MKKNNAEHVGFRNQKLFCFHCGETQVMPLPMTIGMSTAMMNEFVRQHKDCKKTWVEPIPVPENKSERENALWWANPDNGEHGISSMTMFNRLIFDKYHRLPMRSMESHPYDPDDFRRCSLLLKAVPQFKAKLHKMKEVSQAWSDLVDNWDKLEQMLEEQMAGKQNHMYEVMQSLIGR